MWNGNTYGGYTYQPSQYGYGSYQQPNPQPTVQQPTVSTNKMYANGIEDVRYRQLPANSDYIFLDNDKPLVYRKTTDATGKTDIQVFKITPYQEEEKPQPSVDLSNFVSVEDFRRLEHRFDELQESLKSEQTKSSSKKTT